MSDWFDEETNWSEEETKGSLYADDRNFYKVEKWTKDGVKVDRLLYAGNNLDKARKLFAGRDRTPAAHQIDHPTADARARAVAK